MNIEKKLHLTINLYKKMKIYLEKIEIFCILKIFNQGNL